MTSPANAPSNSPAPLLPWPIYRDFAMKHGPTAMASEAYNYAMCDAAMQRLRVAVEALEKIARIADAADEDEADDALTDVAGEVMVASLRIGPLPDLQPHPGEGE